MTIPYALAVLAADVGVATAVGLAFAVAASTFCPLLVLGIWWRGLTDVGAIAGLVGRRTALGRRGRPHVPRSRGGESWASALISQPAAWTVPAAFLTMVARLPDDPAPPRPPRHDVHGPPAHPRVRRRRPRLTAEVALPHDEVALGQDEVALVVTHESGARWSAAVAHLVGPHCHLVVPSATSIVPQLPPRRQGRVQTYGVVVVTGSRPERSRIGRDMSVLSLLM